MNLENRRTPTVSYRPSATACAFVLAAFLSCLPASAVEFSVIRSFGSLGTVQGLTYSGGTLYGASFTTSLPGSVFSLSTDGTLLNNLHTFAGGANDGANPFAPPI